MTKEEWYLAEQLECRSRIREKVEKERWNPCKKIVKKPKDDEEYRKKSQKKLQERIKKTSISKEMERNHVKISKKW